MSDSGRWSCPSRPTTPPEASDMAVRSPRRGSSSPRGAPAATVQDQANFRVCGLTIAKVLVDRGLRSSDNDQVARHAASGRFVRRGRRSGEVCDHLAEQRTEEQELHYGSATLSLLRPRMSYSSGLYTAVREHSSAK